MESAAERKAREAGELPPLGAVGGGAAGLTVETGPAPPPPGAESLVVKTPAPPGESPLSTLKSRASARRAAPARASSLQDDDSAVLLLGCAQVCLGVLMAACGVLALAHGAALGGAGAGLWGGAAAMAAGAAALLAGLRGCWDAGAASASAAAGRRARRPPPPPAPASPALAAALALALVALAVAHLAAVLAVAGLVRDARNPPPPPAPPRVVFFGEQELPWEAPEARWPPLLANAGLLAVAALECAAAAAAALRCYRRVCPCASRRPRGEAGSRAGSPPPAPASDDSGLEPSGSFYSTGSKERLVARWLGAPPPPPPARPHGPPGATPPPLLLFPSHAVSPLGAVYTLPHPPALLSYPLPPPGAGARFLNPLAAPPRYRVRRPPHALGPAAYPVRSRRARSSASAEERRGRSREVRRARRSATSAALAAVAALAAPSPAPAPAPAPRPPPTDEEIGRTYTGLDREIAEEFIAIAMEPGAAREKQARSSSDTMSTESTRLSDK